ncbi:imidazole glycerol phosphate synthase subunit HisH [Robertmurraya andreesenii]|uniref:Imidazole glycerol phosphate synthase subunit HisH n=1 Tax=Anoxybacillus andreesenii TaxID=1325932 RepID=A0ABT9V7X3_9BACL|nr:imidazole glycerol phosphate synthase subunit HisH [Robertmurraya andreesenii]MDQ0157056.1 glutamine amidotransferase [Robertmurraya andreesenii]
MIGIIDYGMGNLFSVSKALERLGAEYFISEKIDELFQADALILPGVGSFKDAMVRLNQTGLAGMIREFVQTEKPLLGICLGMQLLFEKSEENGQTKGLGLLPGKVIRFPRDGLKVPHMGWNRLRFANRDEILSKIKEEHVYFVHSYYVKTESSDAVIASSRYGVDVPAIVGQNQIYGMQFHPEKSGELGMQLLFNFIKLTNERRRSRDIYHLSCH